MLIDPRNECLIKVDCRWSYLALSYVWGGQQGLQLTKANRARLFKPGSLGKDSGIPNVIRDAMNVAKRIDPLHFEESVVLKHDKDGVGYGEYRREHLLLWVDQLCITQDDVVDKAIQIQQMGHVYTEALATIVAIDTQDCNDHLYRSPNSARDIDSMVPDPSGMRVSNTGQVVKNIGGLRLLAALPHLNQILRNSKWMTRAWTLQEQDASGAAIYFSKSQVYFHCSKQTKQEDIFTEHFEQYRQLKGCIQYPHTNFQYPEELYGRQRPTENHWPQSWDVFTGLVENYMQRQMTYSTDILNAFRGVAEYMHNVMGWDMTNCFPTDVLDYSLLWRPASMMRRRVMTSSPNISASPVPEPPTYAWAAWSGHVTYKPYNAYLKSLVESFKRRTANGRTKRITRYGQRWSDPDTDRDIQPDGPYGPRDASGLEIYGYSMEMVSKARERLRHRAFSAGWTDRSSKVGSGDGPFVLQFRAQCMDVRLIPADRSGEDAGGATQLLLNREGKKIGFVWHVPLVDELGLTGGTAKCLLLSKYKTSKELLDQWVDIMGSEAEHMPVIDQYDLINIMLVHHVPGKDVAERLTIGKIHEKYVNEAWEDLIKLA